MKTKALFHARELRNWDFYKKHCRQHGLRSPSKSKAMRQVQFLAGQLSLRVRVWINGVCGCHRYGCKQGPKISLHCLLSKGEAKEKEGKEPTGKHQVLPRAQPSTSGRVALQAEAQCPRLSGLCPLLCLLRTHFPMGVLIWPARLGKAGPPPIVSPLRLCTQLWALSWLSGDCRRSKPPAPTSCSPQRTSSLLGQTFLHQEKWSIFSQ